MRRIYRGPMNSSHKWPLTRKMFPFDDVIMWLTQFQYVDFQLRLWEYFCCDIPFYKILPCLPNQEPDYQDHSSSPVYSVYCALRVSGPLANWTEQEFREHSDTTMTSHERHVASNHRSLDCSFNGLCGPTSKKHQSPHYWPFVREFTGDRWIPRQ